MKQKKQRIIRTIPYIMLLFVIGLVLFPFIWLILSSLKPLSQLFTQPERWLPIRWTFENYTDVLSVSEFTQSLWNSIIMTSTVLVITLTIAIVAAFGFSRFKFRGRQVILYALLLFQFFPTAVFIVPYYNLFARLQLIDTIAAIIIVQVVYSLPFSIWLLASYFRSIPIDLDEAALIDGCGVFGTLIRIILPLARPSIAAAAVYICIRTWQEFLLALTFSITGKSRMLPVQLALYLADDHTEWGALLAGSVIANLPLVILFIIVSKHFTAGLTMGGVKG